MSRCRHRRSHRAAATALPQSRCVPPPPRRRQAAADLALSRCRRRRAAVRWLVVALLSAVRFRHRMPWCRRWGGGLVAAAATTTRTTWRCCTGGGWTSATPTPTAPMRWRGVVIDNLIPSLFSVDIIIFTSTKSEHSDSPWCEPITPLFSEVCTIIGSQKTCLWTDHHTWWGGQTPEYELCFVRVLIIDACGQALSPVTVEKNTETP